jgi:hypothetical protein
MDAAARFAAAVMRVGDDPKAERDAFAGSADLRKFGGMLPE